MGRYTSGGVGRDILAGALAGAAAVWLIDKMDWSLNHTGSASQDGTKSMDPAHAIAAKAADKVGADIGDPHDNPVGHTVHYGVGVGVGALYGLLRGMAPAVATGRGALYGLGTFLLADEIGAPALGLTDSPLKYAAGDHARGALSHTVFGVFTDLGTRLLAPWRNEVVVLQGPTTAERIEGGREFLADSRDYLVERGQPYLDRGRDYYDQGRAYAGDVAERARSRWDEFDVPGLIERGRDYAGRFVDEVRSRMPDRDEVVDRGSRQARRFAETVQSGAKRARASVPDRDDVDDTLERGRRHVSRLASQAREQTESYGGSGVTRALRWLFG